MPILAESAFLRAHVHLHVRSQAPSVSVKRRHNYYSHVHSKLCFARYHVRFTHIHGRQLKFSRYYQRTALGVERVCIASCKACDMSCTRPLFIDPCSAAGIIYLKLSLNYVRTRLEDERSISESRSPLPHSTREMARFERSNRLCIDFRFSFLSLYCCHSATGTAGGFSFTITARERLR